METYGFFAMMARLKWIDRWSLMRNSADENLSQHSLEVAMIAHALCVIGNEVYQAIDSNVADAAVLGVEGTPSFIIGNHLITGYVSRRTFNSMMNEFSN